MKTEPKEFEDELNGSTEENRETKNETEARFPGPASALDFIVQ